MIDTVILRVHGLREHEGLVTFLHKEHIKGISTKSTEFKTGIDVSKLLEALSQELAELVPDKERIKKLQSEMQAAYHDSKLNWDRRFTIQRYAVDHATGKNWEQMYRSFLRSSNYDISYCINFSQDWLELNFSIPKYLYMTNIFQFVPHYFDKDYNIIFKRDWETVKKVTYKRFFRFIRMFFEKEFQGHVDLYNVRVMRMDLCFNKIFDNKESALRYLHDLKRIKKKYLRDNTLKINNYHSGIYHVTRDYTFKVYHKGSEFRNNDRKEIRSIVSKVEMENLQNFSDRILRYELEFRTRYIDTLFKKYIFRKEDKRFKRGMKMYKQVCDGGYAIIDKAKVHVLSMTKSDRRTYEYGKFYANKVFAFFLDSDTGFHKDSQFWDLEIKTGEFSFERDMKFSGTLFSKMVDVFKVFYHEFSVSYTTDLVNIVSQIKFDHVDKKERSKRICHLLQMKLGEYPYWARQVSFSKVELFLELLKTRSFSEIKESKLFPERTFYIYLKFFRTFGFTDYSSSIVQPHGDLDFIDYYDQVERNFSRMDFTKLFYKPF